MGTLNFDKTWFTLKDFDIRGGLSSDDVRLLAETFCGNIERVQKTLLFPPLIIGIVKRYQEARALAMLEHSKSKDESSSSAESDSEAVTRRTQEIVTQREIAECLEPEKMNGFYRDGASAMMEILRLYGFEDHAAVEAMLVSMLLGTWTAFEVLVADLWVTALNRGPKSLAEAVFKASEKQALKPEMDGQTKRETQANEKTVALSVLRNYSYNLTFKMGTLLVDEGKVRFDTFENSIRAYEAAFGKDVAFIFDKKKKDCGNIVFLEAARNVIIHRSGLVDVKFRQKLRHASGSEFSEFQKLEDGMKLPIDGLVIRSLILSTLQIAEDLLKFVDSRMKVGIIEYQI